MSKGEKIPAWRAMSVYYTTARILEPFNSRLCYSGSLRRKNDVVGDVDILCIPTSIVGLTKAFRELCGGKLESEGGSLLVGYVDSVSVNVFMTKPESWGAALMYTTGSREYNISYRGVAKSRGMIVNQYGIHKDNKLIEGSGLTEGSFCKTLQIPWLPPEQRTTNCYPTINTVWKCPITGCSFSGSYKDVRNHICGV